MNNFYELGEDDENKIPIIANIEDLEDEPILCDDCDHVFLKAYKNMFLCPNCDKVYNPRLEHLQRETRERTIEDEADDTGELSFIDEQTATRKTLIRKQLEETELPEYVKQELENIYNRIGYKHVPTDKKLFPSG